MLTVDNVSVRYGSTIAVDRVGLTVPDGEIVAVLGPSGSGKTSLLRAIAGLEAISSGTVRWNDLDVTDVAAHRRDFGLMFQDHALFGHRDVLGNVNFGLRMRNESRDRQVKRSTEMLALVGLSGYEHRRVDQLSGGEQQRVALARALAPSPRLLMLDEPLASVDRERREQLATELHRIIRASSTPTLFVTHDLDEAFTLADSVVILERGHVERAGDARDVWRHPGSITAARFLGVASEWTLTVERGTAITPWGPIPVPDDIRRQAWVGFRPVDLRIDPAGPVAGMVRVTWFRGDHFVSEIDTTFGPLTAVSRASPDLHSEVSIAADLDAAVVLGA